MANEKVDYADQLPSRLNGVLDAGTSRCKLIKVAVEKDLKYGVQDRESKLEEDHELNFHCYFAHSSGLTLDQQMSPKFTAGGARPSNLYLCVKAWSRNAVPKELMSGETKPIIAFLKPFTGKMFDVEHEPNKTGTRNKVTRSTPIEGEAFEKDEIPDHREVSPKEQPDFSKENDYHPEDPNI